VNESYSPRIGPLEVKLNNNANYVTINEFKLSTFIVILNNKVESSMKLSSITSSVIIYDHDLFVLIYEKLKNTSL
jgi:hypothetical protein